MAPRILIPAEGHYIHRLPSDPMARHPDDRPFPDAEQVLAESSANKHMLLTRRAQPSQQGSHFDNPFHFDPNGSTEPTGPTSGWARVVDLRPELIAESDGLAITQRVINAWATRTVDENVLKESNEQDPSWCITLVRTLNDDAADSVVPLGKFPYWRNPNAVHAFIDAIYRMTGVSVQAALHETASVDERDQGYLLDPNPNDGTGGAHGAFHRRGVAIGEFFNLKGLKNGQEGYFVATQGTHFPDSNPITSARFVPIEQLVIQD